MLAMALALPAAAYPISLPQLLRMPLAELLRMEISSSTPGMRAVASRVAANASARSVP